MHICPNKHLVNLSLHLSITHNINVGLQFINQMYVCGLSRLDQFLNHRFFCLTAHLTFGLYWSWQVQKDIVSPVSLAHVG